MTSATPPVTGGRARAIATTAVATSVEKKGSAKIMWRASGDALAWSFAASSAIVGTATTHSTSSALLRRRSESSTNPDPASTRTGPPQK